MNALDKRGLSPDRHTFTCLVRAAIAPPRRHRPRRCQTGLMLIECIVYMAISSLVVGLALVAYYRCEENSRHLRQNAANIVGVLQAGEHWREDVRSAVAPPEEIRIDGLPALRIPYRSNEVFYIFFESSVWRSQGANGTWTQVLSGVKESRMQEDLRQHVVCWRWEVELKTRLKTARMRPLFTFQTVATTKPVP